MKKMTFFLAFVALFSSYKAAGMEKLCAKIDALDPFSESQVKQLKKEITDSGKSIPEIYNERIRQKLTAAGKALDPNFEFKLVNRIFETFHFDEGIDPMVADIIKGIFSGAHTTTDNSVPKIHDQRLLKVSFSDKIKSIAMVDTFLKDDAVLLKITKEFECPLEVILPILFHEKNHLGQTTLPPSFLNRLILLQNVIKSVYAADQAIESSKNSNQRYLPNDSTVEAYKQVAISIEKNIQCLEKINSETILDQNSRQDLLKILKQLQNQILDALTKNSFMESGSNIQTNIKLLEMQICKNFPKKTGKNDDLKQLTAKITNYAQQTEFAADLVPVWAEAAIEDFTCNNSIANELQRGYIPQKDEPQIANCIITINNLKTNPSCTKCKSLLEKYGHIISPASDTHPSDLDRALELYKFKRLLEA